MAKKPKKKHPVVPPSARGPQIILGVSAALRNAMKKKKKKKK